MMWVTEGESFKLTISVEFLLPALSSMLLSASLEQPLAMAHTMAIISIATKDTNTLIDTTDHMMKVPKSKGGKQLCNNLKVSSIN